MKLKFLNAVFSVFLLFSVNSASAGQLFDLYAVPGSYGPGVRVSSCFGSAPWTKVSLATSRAGARVLLQYRADAGSWTNVIAGQNIIGQVVQIRAKSVGTGGQVKVIVTGSCIK